MEEKEKEHKKKYWGVFLAGFLWGITFTFVFGVIFLRNSLIYEYESNLNYDDTLAAVKKAVTSTPGWVVRFGSGCAIPKINDGSRMTVMKLCHGTYGSVLLNAEETRKTSTIIPCTISIYQKSDGKTYISRVNVSLLGSLLGGKIGKIFAGKINPEQEKMLEEIVK